MGKFRIMLNLFKDFKFVRHCIGGWYINRILGRKPFRTVHFWYVTNKYWTRDRAGTVLNRSEPFRTFSNLHGKKEPFWTVLFSPPVFLGTVLNRSVSVVYTVGYTMWMSECLNVCAILFNNIENPSQDTSGRNMVSNGLQGGFQHNII